MGETRSRMDKRLRWTVLSGERTRSGQDEGAVLKSRRAGSRLVDSNPMRSAIHNEDIMRRSALILILMTTLAACGRPAPVSAPLPEPDLPVPTSIEEPVEGSDAQWVPDSGGSLLGEAVASLGDVSRPGAWIKANFLPEDGAEVEIEAETPHGVIRIQVEGIRAEGPLQLSLGGYQALGLSPRTLPLLRVFSIGAG